MVRILYLITFTRMLCGSTGAYKRAPACLFCVVRSTETQKAWFDSVETVTLGRSHIRRHLSPDGGDWRTCAIVTDLPVSKVRRINRSIIEECST